MRLETVSNPGRLSSREDRRLSSRNVFPRTPPWKLWLQNNAKGTTSAPTSQSALPQTAKSREQDAFNLCLNPTELQNHSLTHEFELPSCFHGMNAKISTHSKEGTVLTCALDNPGETCPFYVDVGRLLRRKSLMFYETYKTRGIDTLGTAVIATGVGYIAKDNALGLSTSPLREERSYRWERDSQHEDAPYTDSDDSDDDAPPPLECASPQPNTREESAANPTKTFVLTESMAHQLKQFTLTRSSSLTESKYRTQLTTRTFPPTPPATRANSPQSEPANNSICDTKCPYCFPPPEEDPRTDEEVDFLGVN
ncbi:hypothetical protein C8R47DRAFT_1209155 [Mycena vitilis]|nr:hypothetical protein C8R47DRAFT_1209155 [Mycena vitilis]